MRKDLLDKAIRLADKTTVRPEKVVIAKPNQQFVKKPPALVLSERLYARVSKSELWRIRDHVGTGSISDLLRTLVLDYIDKQPHEENLKKCK